jgi:hypothetical protein
MPSIHIDNSAASLTFPLTNANVHTPSVAVLQSQLRDLQSRYDHLVEVKAKAALRYRQDYRKWRNFKQWLTKLDKGEVSDMISPRRREVGCEDKACKLSVLFISFFARVYTHLLAWILRLLM